ncbi:MAG: phosphatidylglycerophosphatase A [Epsilonproteobacteria bacterium]|nr:phosphatidylglycerophosphatase A [Campylobacterota bacterium]
MREFFLYGFYSGLLPKAPGTWGSIVGGVLGYVFLSYLPQSTLFLFTILISIIAIKEINKYEAQTGIHDDKRIVIDEIAGMFVAISLAGGSVLAVVFSFIYFRILDITKPSVIGRLDKVEGGIGVMGDDLVAGVFAGILAAASCAVYKAIG